MQYNLQQLAALAAYPALCACLPPPAHLPPPEHPTSQMTELTLDPDLISTSIDDRRDEIPSPFVRRCVAAANDFREALRTRWHWEDEP
jgi:hypothetical protein